MKTLLLLVLWSLVLIACWPLALLLIVLAPVVWLLSLPFQLVGLAVGALLALVAALLYLPARLLGHPGR